MRPLLSLDAVVGETCGMGAWMRVSSHPTASHLMEGGTMNIRFHHIAALVAVALVAAAGCRVIRAGRQRTDLDRRGLPPDQGRRAARCRSRRPSATIERRHVRRRDRLVRRPRDRDRDHQRQARPARPVTSSMNAVNARLMFRIVNSTHVRPALRDGRRHRDRACRQARRSPSASAGCTTSVVDSRPA